MTVVVIVNPVAGGRRALRAYESLRDVLVRQIPGFTTVITERPGHATSFAAQAVVAGASKIICFGGDGTVHEICNAIAGTDIALGIIPTGSGNDLARSLGIPPDPRLAVQIALWGRPTRVDAGRVNGRYFINVAGVGFDAEVARTREERFRFLPGTLGFVAAALTTLGSYANVEIFIQHQGGGIMGRSLLLAVANGRYYGGGMKIAPRADPRDGLFDVIIGWDLGKLEAVATIPMVYAGTHLRKRKVTMFKAKELTVTAARPLAIQADGEQVGQLPATFDLVPGALRVLCRE